MIKKTFNRFKQELKLAAVSLAIGLVFATGVAAYSYVYARNVQQDIADNVIRFHVMANSDSHTDQHIKETVRTKTLAQFQHLLAHSSYIEETRHALAHNLDNIKNFAQSVIHDLGLDYPVTASMGQVFFPTRFYGNMAFPPGIYETVQIKIGTGLGSNWWCLMFPPLCYVDMTATDAGRNQLENTINQESFRLVMHQETATPAEAPDTGLVVRFRVVEWWQNRNRPSSPEQNIARR